jgi:hypothetical protein
MLGLFRSRSRGLSLSDSQKRTDRNLVRPEPRKESYQGQRGSVLFLGTGPGSAMIVDRALQPMELQDRKRLGRKNWQRKVYKVVAGLREALEAGHLVLGGGNAKKLKKTLKKMPLSTIFG